jgi:phosphatidate cytidylyltransferase
VALPRILTAIVLIPVVLAAVWFGTLPFFVFILGVSLLTYWEFSLMAEEGGYPNQLFVGLFASFAVLLALYLDGVPGWGPVHRAPSALFIFMAVCFLIFFREFFSRDKGTSFLKIITTITGVLICALFLGHLLLLRDMRVVQGEGFKSIGREIMFFLLIVIWTVDTGAWLVGKLMGRWPMAPVISPKKTWVGAIGGTVLACLAGWFFREAFLKAELGRNEAILYAFSVAVVAQISDLTESLIKRSFGVKNSSELLPGHGGLMDRFDSFIFAAPFFYYVLLGTGRFQ